MDVYILKKVLLEEFMATDPPPTDGEVHSFVRGMTWLEEALSDPKDTEQLLNDYMPVDMQNQMIREQLAGVKDLMAEVEMLRKENKGLSEVIENFHNLSNAEKRQIRMDRDIQAIREEMAKLNQEKDFWCSKAAKLELERMKSSKQ